jgi:hypothetical protein
MTDEQQRILIALSRMAEHNVVSPFDMHGFVNTMGLPFDVVNREMYELDQHGLIKIDGLEWKAIRITDAGCERVRQLRVPVWRRVGLGKLVIGAIVTYMVASVPRWLGCRGAP